MTRLQPRELLRAMFDAAVTAADPTAKLRSFLPQPPGPGARVFVGGAGKCSARMAQALEAAWPDVKLTGLVVVPYGYALPCKQIEIVEAGHPVPDESGMAAARRMLKEVGRLNPGDLFLFLVSGGGSALLTLPTDDITLAEMQEVNRQLLACGAAIDEINAVRKHLSQIKGGRLAAAANGATVVTLAISDVPGDAPAVIASGPTVPDPSTYADARAVVDRYRLELPLSVRTHLVTGPDETPKWGDPRLRGSVYRLVASPKASLDAAAAVAEENGVTPLLLGDEIEGESREVAKVMAGIAKAVMRHGQPVKTPAVLLSGGETTVTLRGRPGKGGRNSEFLLALLVALDGAAGIHAIACDTDGIDGSEDAAGALISPQSLARIRQAGIDVKARLDAHDSYSVFQTLGDLVVTGPTLTNVNDFRAVLIT